MWNKREIDAFVKAYEEEQQRLIKEVDPAVELGAWKNPYGKIWEFEGSRQVAVIYYGTCPHCGEESAVSFRFGTYADPEYPPFCPECGQQVKTIMPKR